MQKITPHLWFDKEAKEAAQFYVSVFGNNSKVKNVNTIHNTPSGSVDIVSFELAGQGGNSGARILLCLLLQISTTYFACQVTNGKY